MANFNKDKKYHIIYKTTSLINGKYYIGMHSTNNLKDGYLGSGKRLREFIRKYGPENFKFEILEYLPTREELIEREIEIINKDLLKDGNCLNLKPGGCGGFISDEVQLRRSRAGTAALQEKLSDPKYKKWWKSKLRPSYGFKGKTHSRETIQKMKIAKRGHGVGSNNSQYGTKWITNGIRNKKIKSNSKIPNGWKLGRIC